MNLSTSLKTLMLVGLIKSAAPIAQAQESIELVVPFSPGGTTDILARTFSSISEEITGQSFTVKNIPGRGGNVALNSIIGNQSDTIGIFPIATGQGQRFLEMGFEILGSVGQNEFALFAASDSALAADNPFEAIRNNSASVGVPGGNSVHRIIAGDIQRDVGDQLTIVPFKNGSQARTAFASGQVDYIIAPVSATTSGFDAIPVAVFSAERLPEAASIPTAKELGLDIQRNVEYVLFADGGSSDETLAALEITTNMVASSEAFSSKEQVQKLLTLAGFRPGAALRSQIESASNNFCKTCNCSEEDCKLNCTKCD